MMIPSWMDITRNSEDKPFAGSNHPIGEFPFLIFAERNLSYGLEVRYGDIMFIAQIESGDMLSLYRVQYSDAIELLLDMWRTLVHDRSTRA